MFFFENIVVSEIVNCNKVVLRPSRLLFKSRVCHAFVIFLTGSSDYLYKDYPPIHAKADDFLFLPSHLGYEVHTQSQSSVLVINFQVNGEIDYPPLHFANPNNSQIKDSMLTAVNSYKRKDTGWMAEVLSLLYRIMYQIQQNQISKYVSTSQKEKLSAAIQYIDCHYLDRGIRVSELVGLCGISEKHFTTLFERTYKTSAKQYIIDKRLDDAKILLETTEITVTDISDSCGFSSVYYFSRLFKNRTGLTPTAYRQTIFLNPSQLEKSGR
ncbi:MAG: AraC family transcriptional regulator [Eubacteriales bacterium]|nr:AraC family transcriptional regulator [Eubacteriales bacterium]